MAKNIFLDQSDINKDKKSTYLASDAVAGAATFGFQSSVGLVSLTTASGQVLMFGELGQEKTEIVKVSTVNSSTGSNIGGTSATISASFRFDHPQDTKVYIIDWDRFEVQHATTVSGTKSTLTAYPEALQPDQIDAQYRDTTKTSGFYFVRFNSTIDSTNSDWSDPIPYAGFNDNTVFEVKRRALEAINEEIDGEVISDDFLNRSLWELRREYHNMPGKRPFRRKFNVDIGNVLTGSFKIELPDDVERPSSAENVFGVRIGTQQNLDYIDKKEWDSYFVDDPHSILSTAYTVGDQDLYVSDPRDFDDSGSVTVEGTTIGYSAKSNTGGTMRISSAGDWNCSVGSDVWQNIAYGLPDKFTVWAQVGGSAYIYFNRPLDTAYIGQNIFADYYRKVVDFNSDADELDEPDYDIFVPALAWKIKKRKNPNLVDLQDSDFLRWQTAKEAASKKEYLGTEIHLVPDVDPLWFR